MIRYANVNFLLIFLASEKAKQSFDDSFHFTTDKFSSNDHMQFCKFFVNEKYALHITTYIFSENIKVTDENFLQILSVG